MQRALADYRLFLRQFRRAYHTTGAILPSGRALSKALVRYVANDLEQPEQILEPRRILEVGPGTGTVTSHLVRALGSQDRLDLVEVNDEFVAHLRGRLDREASFRAVAARTHILHGRVEQVTTGDTYDRIVSGLPLNNFSVAEVEKILDTFTKILRPGGVLSFFEYIWIRRGRALCSGAKQRARLRGIGHALDRLLQHEIQRESVWLNVPPAWVHHVRVQSRGSRDEGQDVVPKPAPRPSTLDPRLSRP